HHLLHFNSEDPDIVGKILGETIVRERYMCYACAVMPDHVHCLIRKHKHHAETMIDNFQAASREAMIDANRRKQNHPVWGGPGWKVFLYTQADMRRIVEYIEANPRKAGL